MENSIIDSANEAEDRLLHIRAYLVRARYEAASDDKWDLYEDYTEALQIIYMANMPFTEFD